MKAKTHCECCRVSTQEVSDLLTSRSLWSWTPQRVEEAAKVIGARLRPDWAGRPTMTREEARAVLAEVARRRAAAQAEADAAAKVVQEARERGQAAMRIRGMR